MLKQGLFMRRLTLLLTFGLVALASAKGLSAQELKVIEHTLDNGLRLFIHENPQSASVDCRITYKVGSADEWAGVTGISHFLEHLMFKGTTTINAVDYEKEAELLKREDAIRASLQHLEDEARFILESGEKLSSEQKREIAVLRESADAIQNELAELSNSSEFDNILTEAGGVGLNASTSFHRTMYTIQLPANKLELFFWVESDRLQNPVFREFYAERDVVTDERLTRSDSSAGARVVESALNTIFEGSGYNIPTVGWPSDLARYTRPQVIDYFRSHYRTDNAAIMLSGNLKAEDAIALADQYFGGIEAPDMPLPRRRGMDLDPLGQRVIEGEAESPMLAYAWQIPGTADPNSAAIEMLATMCNGDSGPLYERFVKTNEALAAGTFYLATEDVGFFLLFVALVPGKNPEDYRPRVREFLQELSLGGLEVKSLERARNSLLRDSLLTLETDAGVADLLGEGFAEGGWRRRAERLAKAGTLTIEDIAAASSSTLSLDRAIICLMQGDMNATVKTQIETRILGLPKLKEGEAASELDGVIEKYRNEMTAEFYRATGFYDELLERWQARLEESAQPSSDAPDDPDEAPAALPRNTRFALLPRKLDAKEIA